MHIWKNLQNPYMIAIKLQIIHNIALLILNRIWHETVALTISTKSFGKKLQNDSKLLNRYNFCAKNQNIVLSELIFVVQRIKTLHFLNWSVSKMILNCQNWGSRYSTNMHGFCKLGSYKASKNFLFILNINFKCICTHKIVNTLHENLIHFSQLVIQHSCAVINCHTVKQDLYWITVVYVTWSSRMSHMSALVQSWF